MEGRMANLEGAYRQVADRLNGIDGRLNSMDNRLEAVDRKIDTRADALDRAMGDMRRDMNQRFMWMIGMIMTSWVTTILTVLLHR
jgi:tetrahydromethanopterin S-methyltransferase subunit G